MTAKCRLFPIQVIARRILRLPLSDTPVLRSILFDEDGNDFERNVWLNGHAHYQDKGATLSKYRIRSSEYEYILAHILADSNDLRDPREAWRNGMEEAPDTPTNHILGVSTSSVGKIAGHDCFTVLAPSTRLPRDRTLYRHDFAVNAAPSITNLIAAVLSLQEGSPDDLPLVDRQSHWFAAMVFQLLVGEVASGIPPLKRGLNLKFLMQRPSHSLLDVVDLDGAHGLGASFQLVTAQGVNDKDRDGAMCAFHEKVADLRQREDALRAELAKSQGRIEG